MSQRSSNSYQQAPSTLCIKRVLLLANPFAGQSKGRLALQEVKCVLEQNGMHVTEFASTGPGDIAAQAREADFSQFDAVGVIGGDGTIHEALNGMWTRSDGRRLPLALVPCGTGNALYSAFLSPSRTPKQCAESICKGNVYKVDCASVDAGGRKTQSFNVINWPADYATQAESMRWLGSHRYNVAVALDILWGRRSRRVRMRIDDEEIEEDIMLVHIQNTKTCGNGINAAPDAKVDDHLLDMFYVRDCGRLPMLNLLHQAGSGGHVHNTNAVFRQFRTLTVEPIGGDPSLVMIDGEIIGTDPISIEIVPDGFEVIV